MSKNPHVKDVLSALAVPLFGFILLLLTFIFNFLVQTFIQWVFQLISVTPSSGNSSIGQFIFLLIILLISWWVFQSRLGELYKAIYSTVPLAVIYVMIGIFLYSWPMLVYAVSILLFAAVIIYLYRTHKGWLYYYTAALVTSVLLIMNILGMDM